MMISMIFWAALGSGIGGAARFLIGGFFEKQTANIFPWATFTVNLTGSLIIGILYALSQKTKAISPEISVFLITGICGGFTTFSAFSMDNFRLIQQGEYGIAMLYVGGSIIAGLFFLWLGMGLTKIFF
jgi:CrcB protein